MPTLLNELKGLSKDFWGTNIVQYYLGNISVSDLQERATKFAENSQQYAEILTETYFYLAKQNSIWGKLMKLRLYSNSLLRIRYITLLSIVLPC